MDRDAIWTPRFVYVKRKNNFVHFVIATGCEEEGFINMDISEVL